MQRFEVNVKNLTQLYPYNKVFHVTPLIAYRRYKMLAISLMEERIFVFDAEGENLIYQLIHLCKETSGQNSLE